VNCSVGRGIAFALIVGVLSPAAAPPAGAQSPPTAQPPAAPANAPLLAPPTEPRPSVVAQDVAEGPDARHCLDLATNSEIIACAEKYRSRGPRK